MRFHFLNYTYSDLITSPLRFSIYIFKLMRQKNNFSGVHKSILNSIIKTGESLNSMIRPTAKNNKLDKQRRCGVCTGPNRVKSYITCLKCDIVICSAQHTCAYCPSCS
jgi:hypothetical protein